MNFTEISQIGIGIIALFLLLSVVSRINAWRIKRVYHRILKDLEQRGAFSPSSAVSLPYEKRKFLRIGLRDFRPLALQHLVSGHAVGVTEDGRYYIKDPTMLRADPREDSAG